MRRRLLIAGGVALALVALAAAILIEVRRGGELTPLEAREHVPEGTAITYRTYPPASGTHYFSTAPYGVYTEPVPEGYWVHNLEHGGIAVLYNCPEGCPELVEALREVYAAAPASARWGRVKMIVLPYSRMDSRLMLIAWGRRERLEGFDRERILQFYQAYLDRGPEQAP